MLSNGFFWWTLGKNLWIRDFHLQEYALPSVQPKPTTMENVPLPPGVPSPNLLLAAGTAFIPLLMGFIWYHPKVFGKAWMVGAGVTEADAKKMNMPLVFGLTYVLSFIISVKFNLMTVHQFSLLSFLQPEMNFTNPPGFDEALRTFAPLAEHKFRTFRH